MSTRLEPANRSNSGYDGRKPGRPCALCIHPMRKELNEAIAMGTATMTDVAQRIGVNKSAVSRHFRNHLQPAVAAAGGGPTLAWSVREKSRELANRMEALLDSITRDSATGTDIDIHELLGRWQAVRGLGAEMREWVRLHGQASGELRDTERTQALAIQIVCPSTPVEGEPPHVTYVNVDDAPIEEIGIVQRP